MFQISLWRLRYFCSIFLFWQFWSSSFFYFGILRSKPIKFMNSYYNFNYLKNTFFKKIQIYLMNTLLICWYIYLLVIRTFPEKPLHVCVCINAYFCAVVVLKRHFLRDRSQLGQETGIRVKVIRDNKSSYLQYFKDKSYGCYDRFSRNFIS